MQNIQQLLETTVNSKASDLHLLAGSAPMLRIDGHLVPVTGEPALTAEASKEIVFSILNPQQKELLLVNKELDFSFGFGKESRFRVNAYFERDRVAAALRLLPYTIRSIEELNMPAICHRLAVLRQGFVLVTGPTGHGKSSTLAAIIEEINQTRDTHIITIEDPLEYIYSNKKSVVSQREMHADTHSWEIALRSVLREDPDVVLIGEMRDYETIAAALTIAETGHLVFATLHTNSASQTVDRIVDVFPEHQQAQIKIQLANTLEAILSQRLLSAVGGGRVPATEIILSTAAVKTNIREGKSYMIDNIIQTSQELGMMSLDMSLADLVKREKISLEIAQEWSLKPEELIKLIHG